MKHRPLILAAALALTGGGATAAVRGSGEPFTVLPNGWTIAKPAGAMTATQTLPQGAALSPDGATLAVVESGFNAPTLSFYDAASLKLVRRIGLDGAMGRPAWSGAGVVVAGANADAIFVVDPATGRVRKIRMPKDSYPVAVAVHGSLAAVATAGDGALRIARLEQLHAARAVHVGDRPGNVAFAPDGSRACVAVRSGSAVVCETPGGAVRRIATRLHPADVAIAGNRAYVAESDADTVSTYDVRDGRRLSTVSVGTVPGAIGASPNSIVLAGGAAYVTLGGANEVAVIRNGHVGVSLPAGWYPTAVAVAGPHRLLVLDGKGEGAHPNPQYDPHNDAGYVAALEVGSLRALDPSAPASPNPQGARGYAAAPPNTILRAGGPIKHVFFILKENRTYDQVLGDVAAGNGAPELTWFGKKVTPNQHALAARFGLFDEFYTSGEVSDAGHSWADTAFANDYQERYWPPSYGGRYDADDLSSMSGAAIPSGGFVWDAAKRAGVSFRDYGELTDVDPKGEREAQAAPSIGNRFDPRYVGWDLTYSDLDRVKEWKREFDAFVADGSLPQLEYVWLPNDHTSGSKKNALTPAAYVATNDRAVGEIVDTISHSPIWESSVIFITEDDAQNGGDHVSDQRSTLYVVSPYSAGGVVHVHYATVSVLRTIEILLGMQPVSAYDATAVPLYAAFGARANLQPFDALPPEIDLRARNAAVAYGERASERADFSRPDAIAPGLLTDILAHNRGYTPQR